MLRHVANALARALVVGVRAFFRAGRPDDRTILLRYTCPREGGGLLAIRGRRGDGVVFEPDSVPLARTRSSAHWRWVEVPIGTVDAGRYRVEIQSLNGPVDCDVLGWR